MVFSKKLVAIIALIIILVAANIALAILYMTKSVTISGGVSVIGAIEVYDSDGTTPLTGYDFPIFTGGIDQISPKHFYINNTGNQPVYVYWNMSSSSIAWFPQYIGYLHNEEPFTKYWLSMFQSWGPSNVWWSPKDFAIDPQPDRTHTLYLGVNQGKELRMELRYTGQPVTAETFTLVISFYAQDA